MRPLQMPGGLELVVLALIFLVPVVLVGLVVYLFYRIAGQQSGDDGVGRVGPDDASQTGSDDTNQAGLDDTNQAGLDDANQAGLDDTNQTESDALPPSIRRIIDWFASFVLVLIGLLGVLAGVVLSILTDRDRIEELVEEEVIESDVLSEEALVEVTHTLGVWGGWGLILAGLLVILAGLVLAGYRFRLDRRTGVGEPVPSMASNALVGAVVTVVVSFVPFSAVVGGGVAGYLQQRDAWAGFRAGVLSGLFVAVPVFIVLGAGAVGLFLSGMILLGLLLVVALLFAMIFGIGMSAIGGYVGGYLVSRT